MSHISRAQERWGACIPNWIIVLAEAADKSGSLRDLGRQLGCSSGAISAILGKTYGAGMGNIESRVRGALMDETVACPVYGALARDKCLDHQARAFSCANPQFAQVWRACRAGCPNARPDRIAKGNSKGAKAHA